MNTDVLLAAEGEGAVHGMQAAMAFIHESEQRFSRFLPASEVSELNHDAGEWFRVSDDLMDMLDLARRYHLETDGLFDPAILPGLKRIGYDKSMDLIRAQGLVSSSSPLSSSSRPEFREIKFDPGESRVLLPRCMEIDLGGIAKGWIVGKAAQLLNSYSAVCAVSAGGDALFIGHPSDGREWEVYLEDPRDPSFMLARLNLGPGAVATSSVMKRTWMQGEACRHHLIDPRTGESANSDWLSVTILADNIITADVFAKAILIGGEGEMARLLSARPGLTCIAVDPDGNLQGSENYKEFIYEGETITRPSFGIPD